jgi:hypothetical protein
MIPTWGSTVDDMVRNGVALSSMDSKRVIVQVPITTVGIEVASKLVERNIRVCLTGFSNDHHALVAATIGVDYALSNALRYEHGRPVYLICCGTAVCRLHLNNNCRKFSVQEAKRVLDALQSKTRILVPVKDFRPDTAHVVEWVKKGYNSFAISPEVARNLVGR